MMSAQSLRPKRVRRLDGVENIRLGPDSGGHRARWLLGYAIAYHIVADMIWSEDVGLELVGPSLTLLDGDEFDLHVWAMPKSPSLVSPGILRLTSSNDVVQFVSGSEGIDVGQLEAPTRLTKNTPIKVVAITQDPLA